MHGNYLQPLTYGIFIAYEYFSVEVLTQKCDFKSNLNAIG